MTKRRTSYRTVNADAESSLYNTLTLTTAKRGKFAFDTAGGGDEVMIR